MAIHKQVVTHTTLRTDRGWISFARADGAEHYSVVENGGLRARFTLKPWRKDSRAIHSLLRDLL